MEAQSQKQKIEPRPFVSLPYFSKHRQGNGPGWADPPRGILLLRQLGCADEPQQDLRTPLPELSAPDKCGAGGTSKNLCPDRGQGLSPTEPSSEACRGQLDPLSGYQPVSADSFLAVPRQPSNDLFEIFEIERGISADEEAKDDPGLCCL